MTQTPEGGASLVRTGAGMTSVRAEGAGPPLILVHGLQVGQELFAPLRRLLTSSFTVVTYDQRDRGDTQFHPSAYTTDDLADDLAALVDALGLARAHVLGTSFGGMVAQAFALRHPDLLDRLVLGATSREPFRPENLSGPVRELVDALERGSEVDAMALLAQMAPAAGRAASDRGIASGGAEALMRRFAATRPFDMRGRLAAITAKTLVLHGRDDTAVPLADALAMADEIADADVFVLARCGHAWENERPGSAAAAIASFLSATR